MKRKLHLKKLFLMTFVASGCASFPRITPTVLDTQLEEGRVYNVDKSGNLTGPIDIISINAMNGYYCLSPKQAAALKNWYLENKKVNNANGNQKLSNQSIQEKGSLSTTGE